MHIEQNITINLEPKDVKQIIIDRLKADGFGDIDPSNINFKVSSHLEGFGMSEHPVNKFDGCYININCNENSNVTITRTEPIMKDPAIVKSPF